MEAYQLLEVKWAEFNELDPTRMVACSSGTAALHLAWECSPIRQANRTPTVICPDLTMVAVPRAIAMTGLTPVFVDCKDDLNIDLGLAEDAIDHSTCGLCAVHTYGRSVDMGRAGTLAKKYGLYLVEDLAEAHGIKPQPFTDAACWSFYKNKVVAGEEGGAVWFRSKSEADKARRLRSLGFTAAHDFTHEPRGHNYRMSNAHARLVLESMEQARPFTTWAPQRDLIGNIGKRRDIESWYNKHCPSEWEIGSRRVPWVYDINPLRGSAGRFGATLTYQVQDRIVRGLQSIGIAARHCFKPMSSQLEFKACRTLTRGMAHTRAQEVVYLPLTPGSVREEQAQAAIGLIREIVEV